MDLVTRQIIRQRGTGYTQHNFRTFTGLLNTRDRVTTHIFDAFISPIPECEITPSAMPAIMATVNEVERLDILNLIAAAGVSGRYAHDQLEVYLCLHDPHTLATEVPVWDNKMTGFIDVLRRTTSGYEIFDYKPNAHKEDPRKVAAQLSCYRQLLIARTGLSKEQIMILFGDEHHIYQIT